MFFPSCLFKERNNVSVTCVRGGLALFHLASKIPHLSLLLPGNWWLLGAPPFFQSCCSFLVLLKIFAVPVIGRQLLGCLEMLAWLLKLIVQSFNKRMPEEYFEKEQIKNFFSFLSVFPYRLLPSWPHSDFIIIAVHKLSYRHSKSIRAGYLRIISFDIIDFCIRKSLLTLTVITRVKQAIYRWRRTTIIKMNEKSNVSK